LKFKIAIILPIMGRNNIKKTHNTLDKELCALFNMQYNPYKISKKLTIRSM